MQEELRYDAHLVEVSLDVWVVGISTDQNKDDLNILVVLKVVFETESVVASVPELLVCEAILLELLVGRDLDVDWLPLELHAK